MLLGINAKKQSGKDFTFRLIQKRYPEAERLAFADPMKRSACAALQIPLERFEAMKKSPRSKIIVLDQNGAVVSSITSRKFIQLYGTEAHREQSEFGNDFWIDLTLPRTLDHKDKFIVVTDVRFKNEAQRVKELGGKILKIDKDSNEIDNHESEQGIQDFDYFINNNGSIENFEKAVSSIVENFVFNEKSEVK